MRADGIPYAAHRAQAPNMPAYSEAFHTMCRKYTDMDWLSRIRRCAFLAVLREAYPTSAFKPSVYVFIRLQLASETRPPLQKCCSDASRWPPRMCQHMSDFLQHKVQLATTTTHCPRNPLLEF